MAVTIADIARRAEVSRQTAGYVVNGQGHLFRPETQRRVLDACRELGYRPNAGARAMRRGRFDAVGICTSSRGWLSNISESLLGGIHDRLAELDRHLVYARLEDERLTDQRFVPKVLKHLMVDGLLINYTHDFPPEMLRLVREARLPAVWINSLLEENCVVPDDVTAGRLATERLISQGHRRIAFSAICFPPGTPESGKGHASVHERYRGYVQALHAAGLQPRTLPSLSTSLFNDYPAINTRFLQEPDAPTALVCYGSYGLSEISVTAMHRKLPVPAMAVFENEPCWVSGKRIDTWIVPWREIGQVAVDMLMQRIESPDVSLPVRRVPFRFDPANP